MKKTVTVDGGTVSVDGQKKTHNRVGSVPLAGIKIGMKGNRGE